MAAISIVIIYSSCFERRSREAATFDSGAGEMCFYLNGELVASRSVPEGAEVAGAGSKGLAVGRNIEAERLTAGFLNEIGRAHV